MPVKCCDLNDKIAIVTGASKGIGKAIANQLSNCGSKIVLVARNTEALDSVKESINSQGGNAVAMPGDISNLNSFSEIRNFGPGYMHFENPKAEPEHETQYCCVFCL